MPARLTILILAALTALALWQHRAWIPAAWDPMQPLDLRAPVTPVTPLKRRLLEADPALCRAALATAPDMFHSAPDTTGACLLHDAVRITGGAVSVSPSSFLASCRLAVDWALFTRAAVEIPTPSGHALKTITHLGSYACRDVRGHAGVQSSHARADAIDVTGFVFADGRSVSVSSWRHPGVEGVWLRRLRDAACGSFGTVLSPDYNADHASHLHLQAGGFGLCR